VVHDAVGGHTIFFTMELERCSELRASGSRGLRTARSAR